MKKYEGRFEGTRPLVSDNSFCATPELHGNFTGKDARSPYKNTTR